MEFTSRAMPVGPKFEDLRGQQFYRLTVTKFAGMCGPRAHWHCRCDCGGSTIAASNHLKKGNVKSCGCLIHDKLIDLTGKHFGRWTVVKQAKKARYWQCHCSCGEVVDVHGESLKAGVSKSCGCLRAEVSGKNMRKLQKRMKSEGRGSRTTHGGSYTAEHRIWTHMKGRCLNPSDAAYKDYGGRGIKVCEQWANSFADFLADVGERPSPMHSLDRIDVNGNYEPSNVRWSPPKVSANNTRRKRVENFSDAVLLAELKRRGTLK